MARRRTIRRAHRWPTVGPPPSPSGSRARSPGMRPPSSRRPAKPNRAGSRVSATMTATATVPAAASPIDVRNGMPTTESAASAMTTVRPANTTAEPAVPTARPAACSPSEPRESSCR